MMADLTIANNAQFEIQTGPKVGSFDGGWGASYAWLVLLVVRRKRAEIWFLCRFYDAQEALDIRLGEHGCACRWPRKRNRSLVSWVLQHSPMALRCVQAAPEWPTVMAKQVCKSLQ